MTSCGVQHLGDQSYLLKVLLYCSNVLVGESYCHDVQDFVQDPSLTSSPRRSTPIIVLAFLMILFTLFTFAALIILSQHNTAYKMALATIAWCNICSMFLQMLKLTVQINSQICIILNHLHIHTFDGNGLEQGKKGINKDMLDVNQNEVDALIDLSKNCNVMCMEL